MSERTPGPWVANDKHSGGMECGVWRIESDAEGYPNDGWMIADLRGPDAANNAEFIVTAVTAHDELVAALKEAILWYGHDDDGDVTPLWLKQARAALAKAESSSS